MDPQEADTCREVCLDIVIPNYNGKQFLATCLESIFRQTFTSFQVIVVDNGSVDGSVAYLHERYPGVKVIALRENKGFSAAVNLGIAAGESPLVFLLNNDTELAPDCLAELVRAAEQRADAFFAPKMLSYRERHILDGAGDGYLRGGVGYRLGTMERDSEVYSEERPVFGACGGAALYRRAMLDRIGLFDEDFFAYLEDVDLNFRANRAGFACRYIPAARVYHIGSATTGSRINPFTVRLSTRNNLYLLLKNYSVGMFFRFLPAMVAYQLLWLLFVIKKGQFLSYCSGILAFFGGARLLWRKRKAALSVPGISEGELAGRILKAENDVIQSIMRRRAAQGKGNTLLRLYCRVFF
jgi:hypothetical protein